ncbi:hypothetical protein Tco_0356730, partial [Tanacetum coccineum]
VLIKRKDSSLLARTSSSLAESLKNYVEELKQGRGQTRQQGHTSEWVSWGKRVGCYSTGVINMRSLGISSICDWEREDIKARIWSFDTRSECLTLLSWAHIHLKCPEDVQLRSYV